MDYNKFVRLNNYLNSKVHEYVFDGDKDIRIDCIDWEDKSFTIHYTFLGDHETRIIDRETNPWLFDRTMSLFKSQELFSEIENKDRLNELASNFAIDITSSGGFSPLTKESLEYAYKIIYKQLLTQ